VPSEVHREDITEPVFGAQAKDWEKPVTQEGLTSYKCKQPQGTSLKQSEQARTTADVFLGGIDFRQQLQALRRQPLVGLSFVDPEWVFLLFLGLLGFDKEVTEG
jgi:hypothetical protein